MDIFNKKLQLDYASKVVGADPLCNLIYAADDNWVCFFHFPGMDRLDFSGFPGIFIYSRKINVEYDRHALFMGTAQDISSFTFDHIDAVRYISKNNGDLFVSLDDRYKDDVFRRSRGRELFYNIMPTWHQLEY